MKKSNLDCWTDFLTTKNVEQFTESLYGLLKNKRFTILRIKREQSIISPDIETSQELKPDEEGKAINVLPKNNGTTSVEIRISTSCGIFTLNVLETSRSNENPSIMFCKKQVVVKWKNPQGKEIFLIFAPERSLSKAGKNERKLSDIEKGEDPE